LANKAAASFTSAMNSHGGIESTLLAINNVLYHWGCVIVPPGYTNEVVYPAGGNPYGASFASGSSDQGPDHAALAAARY
jgi:NAD(P)H dehydrogenase (quinone)